MNQEQLQAHRRNCEFAIELAQNLKQSTSPAAEKTVHCEVTKASTAPRTVHCEVTKASTAPRTVHCEVTKASTLGSSGKGHVKIGFGDDLIVHLMRDAENNPIAQIRNGAGEVLAQIAGDTGIAALKLIVDHLED